MTSERKAAVNRANAQASTGPKTEAGRRRSKMNALRHGLNRAAPDPQMSASAQALADILLAEDLTLDPGLARDLAVGLARQAQVARAAQDAIEAALAATDPDLPHESREALAILEALPRLATLDDHERRAAGRLRKLLRRLETQSPG